MIQNEGKKGEVKANETSWHSSLCASLWNKHQNARISETRVRCLPRWRFWSVGKSLWQPQSLLLPWKTHWEVAWPRVQLSMLKLGWTKYFWIQEGSFPLGRIKLTSYSQHVPQKTNAAPATILSARTQTWHLGIYCSLCSNKSNLSLLKSLGEWELLMSSRKGIWFTNHVTCSEASPRTLV